EWRRGVAEIIREAFIASLKPDIVHIFSLFEGYIDDAVTSIGVFDTKTPVSVTFHDAIPLIYYNEYLSHNSQYKSYYLKKLQYLKKASLIFTTSEFSLKEAIKVLGILEDEKYKIINISEGLDDCFSPLSIDQSEELVIKKKFGIDKQFILYTGSSDYRKNLDNLIRAYARLPEVLRNEHHLVVVGKIGENDKSRLQTLAKREGISPNEIIFTGYVSDRELVLLYNICRLFVFPSIHEGFGLPVLEAMACGAVVIGSKLSSIPEVIGYEEALFDPFNVSEISEKIAKALTDHEFRLRFKNHATQQVKKFSWDKTAQLAIENWENFLNQKVKKNVMILGFHDGRKSKLAYVSPLPPEKSGISFYSSELIAELSKYYDIDIIVNQRVVTDDWIIKNCRKRDAQWLKNKRGYYDRVLYHMGNSPFHVYIIDLIDEVPGVIVLHDFFLSHLMAYIEHSNIKSNYFQRMLYESHGYRALEELKHKKSEFEIRLAYPCNLSILQKAIGIIVHSNHSCELANSFYGKEASREWKVVPHLRKPAPIVNDYVSIRKELQIPPNAFVVCSFGYIDPVKLNDRLLDAWILSDLSKDPNCYLIFVGENHGGEYGYSLLKKIENHGIKDRVKITGWVSPDLFQKYLSCADIAVQLRTLSRGETSGSILDCMNHKLPTIVNAHGSMAELPKDAVWMLPDEFDDGDLVKALETLWKNEELRRSIGEKARKVIEEFHHPSKCAKQYFEAIEEFYAREVSFSKLSKAIVSLDPSMLTHNNMIAISKAIGEFFLDHVRPKHIFLDITATFLNDLKTGIERVVKAYIRSLIDVTPLNYRIEPVYLSRENNSWNYRYARKYVLELLKCPQILLEDDIVDFQTGDVIIILDISGDILVQAKQYGIFSRCRNKGVKIYTIVHDILPLTHPEFFPPNADKNFKNWLQVITSFDGAICVSQTSAECLAEWLEKYGAYRSRPFKIAWNHNGANFDTVFPSQGLTDDASKVLEKISKRPSFLMVGTIEPRKAHLQVVESFDILWKKGYDINLIIVGKEGWLDLPDTMRRNIPKTIEVIQSHPELNRRLFWLNGISDEYLRKVYNVATCLIAASYDEGFGLPLIEAAHYKLPIIARDIPIFREVAGEHAFYFPNDKSPEVIEEAIEKWLSLYKKGIHPKSDKIPCYTWEQSAKNLLDIIINHKWFYEIYPEGRIRPSVVQTHDSPYLNWGKGWSFPEREFRWTDGYEAELGFFLSEDDLPYCRGIRMTLNSLGKQHIEIWINGDQIFNGAVQGQSQEIKLYSANFRNGNNQIVF
ncbi:MAG: glycosyltransferase, partial [Candidatus Jordarchaeaceae archaeon]